MAVNIPSQIVVQTAAQWAADTTVYSAKRILVTSDVLMAGSDQRKFKIANGVDTWSNLDYFLGNVDNTSDANKPVSTAQAAADTAVQNAAATDATTKANTAETNAKAYADTLVIGLLDDRGNFTPSGNYPSTGGSGSGGAIKKGDLWTIAGLGLGVTALVGTKVVTDGDTVRALIDAAGAATDADWAVSETNIGYAAENQANKSTNVAADQTSNVKYPTVKALYDWAVATFEPILSAASFGAFISSKTSKATPADADMIPLMDSAASNVLKKLSWANIKATLKTYFDSLYQPIGVSSYWVTVPGTPVRVGNTSFTITDTSNENLYDLLLGRTTVLKWTDSGNTKMAMVVSATYAADTVTVTIIGDTLAASATMNTFKYSAEKCKPIVFAIAGTLATGTDLTGKWKAPCPMKVFGADALHGTAGTTNATDYDINKNGSTMFTTKVSITSGATVGNGFTADDGTTLALDDVITVDCDAVSTTAPVDAYIYLFMVPLNNQYLN